MCVCPSNYDIIINFHLLCIQEEAAAILRQRKLGFSFVRLLPKETGVRPIVNLRRRKAATKVHLFLHLIFADRNE